MAGIEPANLGCRGEYNNHWITGIFLHRDHDDGDEFLDRIITDDETWDYIHYARNEATGNALASQWISLQDEILTPQEIRILQSFSEFEAEMSVTEWFQSLAADFYNTGIKKSWSQGMTNVSIPELNMFKNISTLAVSVPINFCIRYKSGFVSVNGPRESYFVDALHNTETK